MAPRRAKVNKLDYKKLSANDVICPICRSILIKPVTLPCSHGFCSSCFETTTENANVCPMCRVRVGSWLRSSKSKKLVNETLWQAIQDLFPLQVKNKLNGVAENQEDKYKANERNNSTVNVQSKQSEQLASLSSTSSKIATKTAGSVSTLSKSHNQTLTKTEKNDKRFTFINNFATKEYTCRILCQNTHSKETQKTLFKESQILTQKKNKRIQEIAESEMANDRSNSIESECLYFKPIDYRHNPPSEGLAPIKVPTRKPNVSPHIKILAPSGQNQINMNYLESAFARLCSAASEEKMGTYKKENIQCQVKDDSSIVSKRKQEKSDNKARKKIKSVHTANQLMKSKSIEVTLTKVCDTNKCKNSCDTEGYNLPIRNTIPKTTNFKKTNNLISEEHIKRSLQEQADFELATKLQQTFNQSSAYSTRSTVLKRMAAKNQVQMEIMTP
ncbi:E3 ubiquitin-protein ligase rnf168-like isoform X1 [Zophobas morio]|uniref:E3 ubiquitin-protein ligase rnf168-like isoform X1 n=1 Tax=Zophobas morio TaxID=2755281 RepID=UPI0030837573